MKKMLTLIADEGKIVTNGIDYGTPISLADGVSDKGYYEISIEEYEEILKNAEEISDYEN